MDDDWNTGDINGGILCLSACKASTMLLLDVHEIVSIGEYQ
jgi:hypothetical protein